MPSDRPATAPGEPRHRRRRHRVHCLRSAAVPGRSAGAAVAELVALQAEYAAWLDHLPETLRDAATGEALQTIADLDLDDLVAIEPPRGYGRN